MKYLEKLLNINRFLSTIPPPNNRLSDTLPSLTRIDNTAEKILHLQYSHLTSAAVFSNEDCLLNSISLIFNECKPNLSVTI